MKARASSAPSGRFLRFPQGINTYLHTLFSLQSQSYQRVSTLFAWTCVTTWLALFHRHVQTWPYFNPDFYITRNTFSKIVQKIASRIYLFLLDAVLRLLLSRSISRSLSTAPVVAAAPCGRFSTALIRKRKFFLFLLFFFLVFVMSLLFTGPSFAEFNVVEALAYPMTVAEIVQMSVVYIDGRNWKPVLATDFSVD